MRKRYTSKSSSLTLRSVSRSSRTCWSATSRSPVSAVCSIAVCGTYNLQLVRHTTRNIVRYREISKDIFSFNLILNQIERYQRNLKKYEIKKKGERII